MIAAKPSSGPMIPGPEEPFAFTGLQMMALGLVIGLFAVALWFLMPEPTHELTILLPRADD
jgi:hypothetical protein